jgi:WD40 repeat protein
VALTPDGKLVAAVGNGFPQLWDAATGREVELLRPAKEAGKERVLNFGAAARGSLAVSPDGKLLALGNSQRDAGLFSGPASGKAVVWELATGEVKAVLEGQPGGVNAVAFSPDGKLVATAGGDRGPPAEFGVPPGGEPSPGEVWLWDVATGKRRAALKGHTGPVLAVAFSPDGKALASAAELPNRPAEVKLWDVPGGKELASLRGHGGRAWSVAFSPDGRRLATAGDSLLLWDVTRFRPAHGGRP